MFDNIGLIKNLRAKPADKKKITEPSRNGCHWKSHKKAQNGGLSGFSLPGLAGSYRAVDRSEIFKIRRTFRTDLALKPVILAEINGGKSRKVSKSKLISRRVLPTDGPKEKPRMVENFKVSDPYSARSERPTVGRFHAIKGPG
ncbi:MAG: hypothetical protein KGZ72_06985 [Roseovarius sp.]|jgi:hypothetical protein|nr:hypothetical protein [Roseovarius sp.]